MPKSRKRVNRKGAKSEAVRVKNKLGGRKSTRGAKQLSTRELSELLNKVAKRDRNKLRRELESRNLVNV